MGICLSTRGLRSRQLYPNSTGHLRRTSHIRSTGRGGRAIFQHHCSTDSCTCSGGSPNRCTRSQPSCCEEGLLLGSFDLLTLSPIQFNTRQSLEVILQGGPKVFF